jgi:hypothetical protein
MKFFMLFIFSAVMLTVCGKTVPFRSGEIYFAETSPYKPEIKNWHSDLFGMDEASLYAGVSIKIHPGRKISIFDYYLELNGHRYSCVAIRKNNDDFVYTKDVITAEKDTIYTLLFFLPEAKIVKNQTASLFSSAAGTQDINRFPIPNRSSGPPCPYFIIDKRGNF